MKHSKTRVETRGGRRWFRWSAEEDVYLRQHYTNRTSAQLAEELCRTTGAVKMRLIQLGLTKARLWTTHEDEQLRQVYLTHSDPQIAAMFGCKVHVARYRMRKLGLRRRRWTETEDRYLRKWVGKKSFVEIAGTLGRGHGSVRNRALRLGLSYVHLARRWQPEEEQYLREHYAHSSRIEITRRLQRSWVAVVLRARALKLRRPYRRASGKRS